MKFQLSIGLILIALLGACGKATEETKPIRKDVVETVFASGVLEADGTYQLTAQTDGYLSKVNFEQGDLIRAGITLAVIENPQNVLNTESAAALYEIAKSNTQSNAPSLAQARNTAQMAKRKMELDSIQVIRYQKLLESNSIARNDYDNVLLQYQTSQTNYANALESYAVLQLQARQQLIINASQKEVNRTLSGNNEIRALFSGKVYQKFKQRGDFVKKGDVIATIGDPNLIYAKVNVDEGNISKIQIGQEAAVQLNTNKERIYPGKVAEIYPAFDEASQSFFCKILFTKPLEFKVVNTQLQANIITGTQHNALLIPRKYLDFGNLVTVKDQEKPVIVTTRFVSSDWVQVLTGLDENMTIVTENIE